MEIYESFRKENSAAAAGQRQIPKPRRKPKL